MEYKDACTRARHTCVCMCVFACLCLCLSECSCMCACGLQKSNSGMTPWLLSPLFAKKRSLTGLKVADVASLAGHQTLGTILSLPPLCGITSNTTMSNFFKTWVLSIKCRSSCLHSILPTTILPHP